jgi:hypothetical protein
MSDKQDNPQIEELDILNAILKIRILLGQV